MTSNEELKELILKAEAAGAHIDIQLDVEAQLDEGRDIITAVRVVGLRGVGPNWMPALSAVERLRQVL